MKTPAQKDIVNALLEKGLIDKGALDAISETIKTSGGNLMRELVESGAVRGKDLLVVLSLETGIPPVDPMRIKLDDVAMGMVPEKIAKKYNVIPLSRVGDNLTLVVSDPADILAIDDVKTVARCDVHLALATRQDILATLKKYFSACGKDISTIIDTGGEKEHDIEVFEAPDSFRDLDYAKDSDAAPIVKMVAVIISEAIRKRASDIHIEPQEYSLRVRYRIDGELHDVFDLPKKYQNAVLARVKIMSTLDITENRVPQDGRFRIKTVGKEIDFRVSVLPTVFGNKIVLRALDKSNLSVGLESLGFLPRPLADFKTALEVPFGIILVTGPTGSGKSTTLYSVLNKLNVPEKNIVTIEDPVEYQVEGITQMAVRGDIGLDFAAGLRSILRQTPDVIMVGEIRDHETADTAIKSSLTGHIVLSTLHTNDSIGAITRLVNMGVEPFLVASSLIMSCAQRLLRRICPACKTEISIPLDVRKELAAKYPEVKEADKFYEGRGCSKCDNTGYLGRLGTLETLLMDDEMRNLVTSGESEEKIKEYLRSKNFRTLRENAITKLCKGWTTLEEVLRVT
ncbi:MAG: Flp pilus assembly complex ATPase component TadA [Candidatus Omnitrophica bacterium]|nr:Flp pilus assembly complex ATPase component TadA [Candidatus Omnitrophota bacterium]MBU1128784.1 Flp pilus assembly complex ATPase component TadA [Candidatus Omnitrophota bacterium]MBU1656746.1 Flp pilus assembly complex ATPase component TadA [Candidatus Omnitrophota bacterium]MBU1785215.1 Flp pilus assembly complex ATPase component TadA [Candidatus Omnitrophota bacterium]MBU1851223.1 Flp pilus assembly complex ATPase component TadA [Candidatus Omnitrophota bacterium]